MFKDDPHTGECLLSVTQKKAAKETAYAGTIKLAECPPEGEVGQIDFFFKLVTNINAATLKTALKPIPDNEIFPLVSTLSKEVGHNITIVTPKELESRQRKHLVKGIKTQWYQFPRKYKDLKNPEPLTKVKAALTHDLAAMERFTKHPHPNIVKYHGARVKTDPDGHQRVTGLVLEKQRTDLKQLMRRNRNNATAAIGDIDVFTEQIKSALQHMWNLGWAHNDISPNSIAVTKNKKPILINFRNARPLREWILESGTRSFRQSGHYVRGEIQYVSMKEHDRGALENLRLWLKRPWVIPGEERNWGWAVNVL
ncbi:hypothetical protein QBC44DRAFT_241616 [Cladorrhinum sp. PSN332]|nr:hypothetical protein QBC44DRAFT_241616 [Cladorrhinum sp. PSN332]